MRKHFIIKVLAFFALVCVVSLTTNVKMASANYFQANVPSSNCGLTPVANNGVPAVGTGYAYQTFIIGATTNAYTLGETAVSMCNLTRANLSYNGLVPDQIWEGTSGGGVWTAPGVKTCVPTVPDATMGTSQCTPNNGDYAYAEDDAAAFSITNSAGVKAMVACNGMSGTHISSGGGFQLRGCPGPDIYDFGTQPSGGGDPSATPPIPPRVIVNPHDCRWTGVTSNCFSNDGSTGFRPIAGAGFLVSARNLTNAIGSSQGLLNPFSVTMWYRNTYSGGYGAEMVITLRYPQRDSACTSTAANMNKTVTAGVSSTDSFTFKNTGKELWRSTWAVADPRGAFVAVQVQSPTYGWMPSPVALPSAQIDPNASATFNLTFTAPSPGTYNFTYQMEATGEPPPFGVPPCSFTITVNPAPSAACTGGFIPPTIGLGGSFGFTVKVTNTSVSGASINGPMVLHVVDPNGAPVPAPYNSFTVPGAPTLTAPGTPGDNFTYTSPPNAILGSIYGIYKLDVTYGGVAVTGCNPGTTSIFGTVENNPYVRVYGADISAGMYDPSGSCTGWGPNLNTGNVRGFIGFSGGAPDVTKGAGAQLGIFALGAIDNNAGQNGFSSAMLRTAFPNPAISLDFANTGSGTPGVFTIGKWCGHDFYNDRTSTTPGPLNIGATSVANGTKTTRYVNGNVIITGDITYAGANSWTTATQIPSYTIVANGDIYIDHSVTQLDGTYVAQGGVAGSKGAIYTCTIGPNQLSNGGGPGPNKFVNCNKQLIVNGSLVAKTIHWQRTYGSVDDSQSGESLNSTPRVCTHRQAPTTTSTCASEVVNYSPEIYATPGTLGQYDYVTDLPPIL